MTRIFLTNEERTLRNQIKALINFITTSEIYEYPCALMAVQLNELKVLTKKLHITTCKLSASLKKKMAMKYLIGSKK